MVLETAVEGGPQGCIFEVKKEPGTRVVFEVAHLQGFCRNPVKPAAVLHLEDIFRFKQLWTPVCQKLSMDERCHR